jgi:twitching motility protein PilT
MCLLSIEEFVMQASDAKQKIRALLKAMIDKGASDMHITVNAPPYLRVDGNVFQVKLPPLSAEETKALCYELISEEQKVKFEQTNELDFSFTIPNLSRFRANLYVQKGAAAIAIRTIPFKILTAAELGLPQVVSDIANKPSGLVLVTGPTGSGKSTTLASIIDKINSEQRVHILTIEDPIEFVHTHKLAVVNQREVGEDTKTFAAALKSSLRQDPDVVLIGEMRDLETIEAALTISETGHLVFGTLHTNSAVSTINRIIDVFPPHQQDQIRTKLSFVLQAVLSQQLLPKMGVPGRAMALEIMMPNSAIRNLIREGKVHQMYGAMQVGQDKFGMQTLNQALYALVQQRVISVEEAMSRAIEVEEFRSMLERGAPAQARPMVR